MADHPRTVTDASPDSRQLLGMYSESLRCSPKQLRAATIRMRMSHVRHYVAAVDDWHVATTTDVERWAARRGLSRSATRDAISHVRQFYRWACRQGFCTTDPTQFVDLPRRGRRLPRPAREIDIATALGIARASDPEMYAILCLMAGAGLRCLEVAMLRWRDVDLLAATVRVEASKCDRDRVLEVTGQIRDALAVIERTSGFVVFPDQNESWTGDELRERRAGYVSRKVGRFLQRCEVDVSAHQLRHRFATVALEQCGDITVVRDLLGHVNVSTTEVYAAVARGKAGNVSRAIPLPA